MINDLERPAFARFPFLAELKMWLLDHSGVRAAMMSGSGATVFAILEEGSIASELVADASRELDPKLWWWTGSTSGALGGDCPLSKSLCLWDRPSSRHLRGEDHARGHTGT